MEILNLTQHLATDSQLRAGVRDLLVDEDSSLLKSLLTFATAPTADEIRRRATAIAQLAVEHGYQFAMIGGAGYLMPALEQALLDAGVTPLHAFTVREVVETTAPDGNVIKTAVFKHGGWVTNYPLRRISATAEDADGYEYQGGCTFNVLEEDEEDAVRRIFASNLWITSIRSEPVLD